MTTLTLRRALLAGAALALALPALAHDTGDGRGKELFKPGLGHAATQAAAADPTTPPLYAGLGKMGMPVTTVNPEAQAYFDQGLRLAWGFNHAEARRAFAHARTLDPSCAMCFWGEAFVMGPNINDAMDAADIRPAWNAISRAREACRGGHRQGSRADRGARRLLRRPTPWRSAPRSTTPGPRRWPKSPRPTPKTRRFRPSTPTL